MAYNGKAKVKVLYLWKILQEETDAKRGLTMAQIIERLAEYGVSAERKSIYDDIKTLQEFGVDVKKYHRNPAEYGLERRDFTLDELMLMVDAIQSCRSISERQARMLVTNIKQLANNRERELLDRRIHVEGRIKSQSDSVLSLVDMAHDAIRLRHKLEFSYRRMGIDGKPHETYEGKAHVVTPVMISYDDGFYYLAAWNERHESMSHYRLDRMFRARILEDERATENDVIAQYRANDLSTVMFGRFAGKEVTAVLAADEDKVEIITDRFGSAATFLSAEGPEARARVRVCKSEQFFGWVASMGRHVRIVEPTSLVEEYKDYLRYLLEDSEK